MSYFLKGGSHTVDIIKTEIFFGEQIYIAILYLHLLILFGQHILSSLLYLLTFYTTNCTIEYTLGEHYHGSVQCP